MSLRSIPVQLHPKEIRFDEGNFESTWTPGDTIGKFQEWTRFWVRQNAEMRKDNDKSSLLVYVRPCVRDTQLKLNPFKKKFAGETFETCYAQLEPGKDTELLSITPSNLHAVLVWTDTDDYEIDQTSLEKLFPDSVKIEQQGTAWVVYEKMLTSEEKIQAARDEEVRAKEERFLCTTDIVTGEKIRTLPFSNVDQQTGSAIYEQLTAAFGNATEGKVVQNITRAVQLCDEKGPFKGFLDIFSDEEQNQLHAANSALVQKVYKEFLRHLLTHDVEKLLVQADTGLTTHIDPVVSKITNQEARESIERTMQTWKHNRKNPHRNLYLRSNRSSSKEDRNPGRAFVIPTHNLHPDYFAVCKMDESIGGDNVGGGYDATMGILMLQLQEREYDFLDALNVMHELTHKNQHTDAVQRSGEANDNHNRYVKGMIESNSTVHGVLEEECEAWSNMIELLFAKIGFGTHNIANIMDSLGIPQSDNNKGMELYQIMEYGAIYYKGGGRQGNTYPPGFVEKIKELYLKVGGTLHVLDEDGFPVLFKGEQ